MPYERSGKVIVAVDDGELGRLDALEARARENQVEGLRRLSGDELRELEPHCRGVAALHSPSTGVVDFAAVARALADELAEAGVEIATGCGVTGVEAGSRELVLEHAQGRTAAGFAVFCAGARSDVLAERAGAGPDPRIVPFVGRYLYLRPERAELVRSLIYPVPDPSLPFLGVHLSRHVDGRVSLGPTALLQPRARALAWPGTWRMAARWWRTGLTEIRHAVSRRALASAAARYVPEIGPGDFEGGFSGVRAQALARDGTLVDDFVVSKTERALHVRNAPVAGGHLGARARPADRRRGRGRVALADAGELGAEAVDRAAEPLVERHLGLEAHQLARAAHVEVAGRLPVRPRRVPDELALVARDPLDQLGKLARSWSRAPCPR